MDHIEIVQTPDSVPLQVEVVNVDEFHESIMDKVAAGVAVTLAIGLVKLGFDIIKEKRAQKNGVETAEKPDLKTVK